MTAQQIQSGRYDFESREEKMNMVAEFRGTVRRDGSKLYLESGGIRVELIPADTETAGALAELSGVTLTVEGTQDGASIMGASLARAAESAGQQGPDPMLVEILGIALDPPASLRQKLEPFRDRIVALRPGYRIQMGDARPTLLILTRGYQKLEGIPTNIGDIPIVVQAADPEEQLAGDGILEVWRRTLLNTPTDEAAPAIGYTPPEDVALDECTVGNITCHVGPDSGWSTLAPFLDETTEKLTVTMFDFNADHIIQEVAGLGAEGERTLRLVLQQDKPAEAEAIDKIRTAWGERFEYTRAVVSGPNRIFANSFHTKIAVRDSGALWLSSGNWTRTSQPLVPSGPQPTAYRLGNREWHVIIEDATLAGILEKYIEHDFKQASEALVEEAAPLLPDLLVPADAFEEEAAAVQPERFDAKSFAVTGRKIRVQPLMTPDNYPEAILDLISGAERSLWMQYSYIRGPRENDKFKALLNAVAGRMKAGVDVRVLIDRRNQKPADTDALIALGWKPAMMRLQTSAVHNKGILVDQKIAVVGSQNWSPDGTQFNRDASLIFYSTQIAKYFGKVFDFDWNNLAKPVGTGQEITPLLAPESGPTPPGMVRVPWADWYQES